MLNHIFINVTVVSPINNDNLSFTEGCFPGQLKCAEVKLLVKKHLGLDANTLLTIGLSLNLQLLNV